MQRCNEVGGKTPNGRRGGPYKGNWLLPDLGSEQFGSGPAEQGELYVVADQTQFRDVHQTGQNREPSRSPSSWTGESYRAHRACGQLEEHNQPTLLATTAALLATSPGGSNTIRRSVSPSYSTDAEGASAVPSQRDKPPVISYVREFLREFQPSDRPTEDSSNSGFPWIGREGVLYPTREEKGKYQKVLIRLHSEVADKEDLSSAALDTALRAAVFHVVDLSGKRGGKRRDRVRNAAEEVESFVGRPARDFVLGIEVRGFDVDTIPFDFGRVRFERMSDVDARIIGKPSSATAAESAQAGPRGSEEASNDHDAVVGSIKIRARDGIAAERLGERVVRETVECLNHFLASVHPVSSALYVLTERTGASSFDRFIWDSDGEDNSYRHAPSPDLYSINAVRERQGPAVERVQDLLKSESRNEVEELLLQGVRWGGRALAAHTAEDSIAFAFTALECVLVPSGTDDIVQRLAPRVGWLTSQDASVRDDVSRRTKKAYDIRSRIVHDGRIEVGVSERDWVIGVMLFVLNELLTSPDIEGLVTAEDLEKHLVNMNGKPVST